MPRMKCIQKALTASVVVATAATPVLQVRAQELPDLAAGQRFVEKNCARCHAIGRTGQSTHPEAPPFRTLSQRYPISALDEALVEGLSTGHPDMPEFIFSPAEADAIIGYLESIQDKRP